MFWQILQSCSGQVRTAGMGGIIGYDLNVIFASADALGLERDVVLALLPAAEAGMREGIAKVKEQDDEEQLHKRERNAK